jgi:signal transduction histidine kinase
MVSFAGLSSQTVLVSLIIAAILLAGAIIFLLLWLRTRRAYRSIDFDRSRAEHTRIELELSVAEQRGRLRIIRELHDVAVHSVSTIIAQADGARYAGSTDPSAAVRAASAIAETGRSTLADMRRVMALVRESEADAAPQPRLKSTRDLFKVMRDAGLRVEFEETGQPYDLKPGAELAVYRILQEALSNTLKYGGDGTEVRVLFTWTERGLQVRVDDNGFRNVAVRKGLDPNLVSQQATYTVDDDLRALTEEIIGPGIGEMRERTELFGGVFSATQVPGVGFSISAVFPSLRFHNGVHGVDLSKQQ